MRYIVKCFRHLPDSSPEVQENVSFGNVRLLLYHRDSYGYLFWKSLADTCRQLWRFWLCSSVRRILWGCWTGLGIRGSPHKERTERNDWYLPESSVSYSLEVCSSMRYLGYVRVLCRCIHQLHHSQKHLQFEFQSCTNQSNIRTARTSLCGPWSLDSASLFLLWLSSQDMPSTTSSSRETTSHSNR